jgi:hypothetical protein
MAILPEVFEPAEIGLDGASVVTVVGELEPAGMPQHVGMHEQREFRSHARPGHHALISGYGQRRATLRDEEVWGQHRIDIGTISSNQTKLLFWNQVSAPALIVLMSDP